MKKVYLVLALLGLITASCAKQERKLSAGIEYEAMDLSVKPGDKFSQYASGNWCKLHERPADYAIWGAFYGIDVNCTNQLKELILDLASKEHEYGSVAQKVSDLYNLKMDSVRLNTEKAEPLKKYLDKINSLSTREEFINYTAKEHDCLFWGMGVTPDQKNSKMNIVGIGQSGLSLGDETYYLNNDPTTEAIREAFKQMVVDLHVLCGYTEAEAKSRVGIIMKHETELAKVFVSKENLRDPEGNYHKMSVDELCATTGFDWKNFLAQYGYNETTEVDLGQIEPVKKGCDMLQTLSLDDLKVIYTWHTISSASSYLGDEFRDVSFRFSQALTGVQQQPARWKSAIGLVSSLISDAVGQMYVERYFSAEAKERALQLVLDLQSTLRERIAVQSWMSEETKKAATEKLDAFIIKIGYPDKWDDLSGLVIDPKLSLLDNVYNARNFFFELSKQKKYNKPVDNAEWHMSPHTVNAYYNPTTNEICFPAAILQPPFFDVNSDDAANYGAIGVVIGHEMTHGFDDQGRQFDKEGNLHQWWSEEDVERFMVPANQMREYFDSLEVLPATDEMPALMANGSLCLGENLADHGGVNVAYYALKKAMERRPIGVDNGFTPEQRFFLAYGRVWSSEYTEQIIRYLTTIDVHSINYLRIDGTLPHIDGWYEAFDIKEGDALYLPKEKRVNIW